MFSRKMVLHFPPQLVDKPIIYRLTKDYNLEFNILKALVTPDEEGLLILELKGEKKDYDNALKYLKEEGVKTEALSKDVVRNERCIHCDICVPVCPVSAFEVDNKTREVIFNKEKCIGCELCINICPYKALEVKF
ncbi:MAG: 4Fe-4S binding protein [Candidatus Omnitrophota bacterium]|nr:4Fe-4S binding protein [Candidatus Omnitrophota bacterium]